MYEIYSHELGYLNNQKRLAVLTDVKLLFPMPVFLEQLQLMFLIIAVIKPVMQLHC